MSVTSVCYSAHSASEQEKKVLTTLQNFLRRKTLVCICKVMVYYYITNRFAKYSRFDTSIETLYMYLMDSLIFLTGEESVSIPHDEQKS